MKKLLILVLAVLFLTTIAYAESEKSYNTPDSKKNYIWCQSVEDTIPGRAALPADYGTWIPFVLVQVEACTTGEFDIDDFDHGTTIFQLHEHDADTAHINVYLQVSIDASNWADADTNADIRTADSTWFSLNWDVPAGALYGRFIYVSEAAAACTSRVRAIWNCFQQDD